MVKLVVSIIQVYIKVVNALSKRFWHKYSLWYLDVHNVRYDEKLPPHFWGGALFED